jgi:hypothetical protein
MSIDVLELAEICAIDTCARRVPVITPGWTDICDECAALSDDHSRGLHAEPVLECRDCF